MITKKKKVEEYLLDIERESRLGFIEVIYAAGKTPNQVCEIFQKLIENNGKALATRCSEDTLKLLKKSIKGINIDYISKVAWKISNPTLKCKVLDKEKKNRACVSVVAAGTSDMPVAEECAITLEFYGINVNRVYDVGVAGLHRLLERLDILRSSKIVIVIAGMEGALPSVVGGLISKPVIAVPTSVGYGANFSGLSALLAMLNSCASGIVVVNIDNGFGAAIAAIRILNSFKEQK